MIRTLPGRVIPSALRAPTLLLLAALASGCAPFRPGLPSEPIVREEPAASGAGAVLASEARAQIGVPYRWGGDEPRRGFDCSGLVAYVHAQEGIPVPRTAAQQFAAARKVDADELRPGDLVFFRLDGRRQVSHVGIYTGQRRFVHAPQSGRDVGEASLDDPYYRERFAGAGRFYGDEDGRGPRLKSPP
jgi:cell wall-associated NlpC family hydrolase